MPIDSPLSVVFSHARISVSFYRKLRCKHCYVTEEYRDQCKRLLKPSHLSIDKCPQPSLVDTGIPCEKSH